MPAVLVACSSSSQPTHNAQDYRAARIVTNKAQAYQDTYTGDDDWIISADSTVTFADGSSEPNNIELHYDGQVADEEGMCVFTLDDDRDAAQGRLDSPKIVRRCDGKAVDTFVLGDLHVSIVGHPMIEDGLSVFHIDNLWAPKLVEYSSGHSPSNRDNSDEH